MLIHQGKRPECQRIRSLMNFWTLSHCRLWDDHETILYDREILCQKLIWNKGRVWNNDTNYWKHYFNELAVHFNFYSAYLQVSLKNYRYLEVLGCNRTTWNRTNCKIEMYDRHYSWSSFLIFYRDRTPHLVYSQQRQISYTRSTIIISKFLIKFLIWVQKTTKYTKFHSRELNDCTFYSWNDIFAPIQFLEWSKWYLLDEQSAICSW